jgi:hypothetical protein
MFRTVMGSTPQKYFKNKQNGAGQKADRNSFSLPPAGRLLDAFDNESIFDADVIEKVSLERVFGRWRTIETARCCSSNGTVSQRNIGSRKHIIQINVQVWKPLPDLTDRSLSLFPIHETVSESDKFSR